MRIVFKKDGAARVSGACVRIVMNGRSTLNIWHTTLSEGMEFSQRDSVGRRTYCVAKYD